MRHSSSFALLMIAGATSWSSAARSAPPAPAPRDAAAAEVIFRRAKELLTQGEVARACGLFAESLRLDPATGTLLNLAACEEKNGKLATAWQHFVDARAALPAGDFRIEFTDKRIAELEPRVPKLTISLGPGAQGARDVRVLRDDIELGPPSLGLALPADPGGHALVVRARGHAESRTTVELTVGERKEVVVDVGAPQAESDPTIGAATVSSRKTWGYVIGGAGVLSLGVGIVSGIITLNAASRYESSCSPDGACTQRGLDAASTGRTFEVVSPIAIGVGAAAVAAGLFLVLTSPKNGAARSSTTVAPAITQSAASISMERRF